MKAKYLIIAIVIVALAYCLVPRKSFLTDGGTVIYYAPFYEITDHHAMNDDATGYYEGLVVKIFGHEMYNSFLGK